MHRAHFWAGSEPLSVSTAGQSTHSDRQAGPCATLAGHAGQQGPPASLTAGKTTTDAGAVLTGGRRSRRRRTGTRAGLGGTANYPTRHRGPSGGARDRMVAGDGDRAHHRGDRTAATSKRRYRERGRARRCPGGREPHPRSVRGSGAAGVERGGRIATVLSARAQEENGGGTSIPEPPGRFLPPGGRVRQGAAAGGLRASWECFKRRRQAAAAELVSG